MKLKTIGLFTVLVTWFLLMSNAGCKKTTTPVPTPVVYDQALRVRGVMNKVGDSLKRVDAAIFDIDISNPHPNRASGVFEVQVQYINGTIQTIPFNARVVADANMGPMHGFFELYIPCFTKINALRIIRVDNQKVMHNFAVVPLNININ